MVKMIINHDDYNDREDDGYNDDYDRFGFVLLKNVPVEEGPVPALQVRACPAMTYLKMTISLCLCRFGRGSRR